MDKIIEKLEKLKSILGIENVENLANMCERVQERAIERDRDQSVTIGFSRKGYVDYIDGTDRVNGHRPKKYIPE